MDLQFMNNYKIQSRTLFSTKRKRSQEKYDKSNDRIMFQQ